MEQRTSIASAQIDYKLLAHLSHDVRSPFNGLIGFSELLSSHFDELSDERKKEYATLIRQLSRKSFFQLQLFSIWVKLISNNLHLNLSVSEFTEILFQAVEFCSNDLETRNIQIIDDQPSSLRMHVDANALTVALFAILTTAIQAMSSNETLHIKTIQDASSIKVSIKGKFSELNNPGSDPFQLDLLAQNEYSESSSKLWIAKQIIDKHSGSLSFPSQPDELSFEILITLNNAVFNPSGS